MPLKLGDIPKEAEKKAATEADLRKQIADGSREIAELRRQVAANQKAAPDPAALKKAAADGYRRGSAGRHQ